MKNDREKQSQARDKKKVNKETKKTVENEIIKCEISKHETAKCIMRKNETAENEKTKNKKIKNEKTKNKKTKNGKTKDGKIENEITASEISVFQKQYLRKLQNRQYRITSLRILIFAAFLFLWEAAVRCSWIDGFIFSSPSRVAKTFYSMWLDRSIFLHTGITIAETLVSFLLVVVLGLGTAVLLWYFTELSEILEPYLVILNSLPKSALAPLLIVWLGANMKSIIVAGMSVAIFGTILNLYTGFRETDPDDIKLIYTLQGKKRDVLTKVILPGTRPLMLSVMKVNIGLCLVGVVIGEFIGARQGLGYLIIYGSQVLR